MTPGGQNPHLHSPTHNTAGLKTTREDSLELHSVNSNVYFGGEWENIRKYLFTKIIYKIIKHNLYSVDWLSIYY